MFKEIFLKCVQTYATVLDIQCRSQSAHRIVAGSHRLSDLTLVKMQEHFETPEDASEFYVLHEHPQGQPYDTTFHLDDH